MENKSLMSIVEQTADLETLLIESGGELTPEIEALLAVNEKELASKADGYAMVIERMEDIAQFYKRKAEALNKLAKAAEGVATGCKERIKFAMQTLNTNEIAGNDIRFKLQPTNPSCLIENEDEVDPLYKKAVTEIKIDKKKIAEDLKLGVPVKGAKLIENLSLRTYPVNPARLIR